METTDWYSSWFDTHYYHTLYKHRDEEEAELFIRQLMSYLQLPMEAEVLDLACGKGRHALMLNRLGYRVTGADLSENSINAARQFENDRLQFVVHDMRDPLELNRFDAVLNLFTSFGYFDNKEDNCRVMQVVGTMLQPNGIFVIDFMNTHKVVRELVAHEEKTIDGIHFGIKRWVEGSHILKTIQIHEPGKTLAFTEQVQALTLDDFQELFSAGGFELIRTFGDFDLSDFNPEQSDRLILIARKNQWK